MTDTTVLLVDDEEDFVAALAERLEVRGLRVDTAGSGAMALEKARGKAPARELVDIDDVGVACAFLERAPIVVFTDSQPAPFDHQRIDHRFAGGKAGQL